MELLTDNEIEENFCWRRPNIKRLLSFCIREKRLATILHKVLYLEPRLWSKKNVAFLDCKMVEKYCSVGKLVHGNWYAIVETAMTFKDWIFIWLETEKTDKTVGFESPW